VISFDASAAKVCSRFAAFNVSAIVQAGVALIPTLTKEAVKPAMARFDADLRNRKEWYLWEQNNGHRYAIENAGQRYPAKQIVSLASRSPVAEFSGRAAGGQANAAIDAAGFQVVTATG
jgi:hypothetical protein